MDPGQIVQVFLFGLFGGLTAILAAITGPTYDNIFVPEMSSSALFPPLSGGGSTFVSGGANFSAYLLVHLVDPAIVLVALAVGIAYLVRAVAGRLRTRLEALLPRLVLGVILANFSLPLAGGLLSVAGVAFPVIADFDGGLWQHWINIDGWGALAFSWDNGVLAFVLSIALFSLVMMLVLIIAVRDALIAVLLVLLPIFTLLWSIPTLEPLARRAWFLFGELAFLPCVLVIPLELAVGVPTVALAVGYLTVAASAPTLVSIAGNGLSSLGFPSSGAALSGGAQRGLSFASLGSGALARPIGSAGRGAAGASVAGSIARTIGSAPFPASIPILAADFIGRGAGHLARRLPQAARNLHHQRERFRAFREIPRTCGWKHV
ncbi:MAG: hypothetical protein L3K08_07415 [Thermoplasmata archaeon]|nr:hypothetical protein [Thermoplasmata archaeon]